MTTNFFSRLIGAVMDLSLYAFIVEKIKDGILREELVSEGANNEPYVQ